MKNTFITTNITGIYVFQNGKLKDSILFSAKDIEKISKKLANEEILEEETKLMNKYDSLKISSEEIKNNNKLKFIKEFFAKPKSLKQFKFINTILTKRDVKNSVTPDLLIIQSTKSTDDLKKSISMLIKRLREWYEIYNPEYSANTYDHDEFVETINSSSLSCYVFHSNLLSSNIF